MDYYCYTSTDKGAWRGIVADPGSTIDMGVSTVTDAEVGITLDNPADANLLVCEIADARDIGLWIKNCYTAGPVINTCSITRTGDYSGNFRTRNVLIESCEAAPTFTGTGISKAIKNDDGQYHYGGHGVEITGSEEVLFDDCTVSRNDSCGFYIHNTVGPYILDTRVDANGINISGQGGQVGAGIYVRGGNHWTTLRESRVYGNSYGLYLYGSADYPARIRGWYHADQAIDPNTPADVDSITIRRGLNCIYENTHNVWSAQNGRCDLGSEYMDGSGVYVTLGGFNGVFDPVTSQGRLDYYSYGGFREVWWNNDPDIPHYNGSVFDNADELLADSVGCSVLGKRGNDDAVEFVRRLIAQYRTRGQNASQQSAPEADRVSETPAAGNCMIDAIYPNPFNPRATISVVLHEPQAIRLVVTDMLGREVAVLADGFHEAGRHRFTFDGDVLASGTYIAVLRGASSVSSMPLLLAK